MTAFLRTRIALAAALLAACFAAEAQEPFVQLPAAPSEIVLPLHHGCGSLVYTCAEGWAHRPDTTGALHFPRRFFFDGDLGHSLRAVIEYDADGTALNKWRMWPTDSGIAVEQESYGRCFYDFDSLGCATGVRCENMAGEPRPAPGTLAAPAISETQLPGAGGEQPDGAESVYAFDAGGCPTGQVSGAPGTIVVVPGLCADALQVNLADPEHDPAAVRDTTRVEIISAGDVHYSLRKVGVYNRVFRGLIAGLIYLKRESEYYGLLDFARSGDHPVERGTYYVAYTKQEGLLAHDNYNFGNFLWGAAAQATGVPLWIARLGSHISNMMHTGGEPDSPDDILSIGAGYHFSESIGPVR